LPVRPSRIRVTRPLFLHRPIAVSIVMRMGRKSVQRMTVQLRCARA
jgi:hypothetical protein